MQTVEKLRKRCIIKFTEGDMQIICVGEVGEGGVQIWSYVLSLPLPLLLPFISISFYISISKHCNLYRIPLEFHSHSLPKTSSSFSCFDLISSSGNPIPFLLTPSSSSSLPHFFIFTNPPSHTPQHDTQPWLLNLTNHDKQNHHHFLAL